MTIERITNACNVLRAYKDIASLGDSFTKKEYNAKKPFGGATIEYLRDIDVIVIDHEEHFSKKVEPSWWDNEYITYMVNADGEKVCTLQDYASLPIFAKRALGELTAKEFENENIIDAVRYYWKLNPNKKALDKVNHCIDWHYRNAKDEIEKAELKIRKLNELVATLEEV